MGNVAEGYCQCGCGGKTFIWKSNAATIGRVKGTAARFLSGHQRRGLCALSDADRFWPKVDRSGGPDSCWPFTGTKGKDGYGVFRMDSRQITASRVALILSGIELLQGSIVCHKCDQPGCCNPNHLFAGSHGDNHADMVSKGRCRRKLSNDMIREARRLYASGDYSQQAIADMLGVSQAQIGCVVRRKSWPHV